MDCVDRENMGGKNIQWPVGQRRVKLGGGSVRKSNTREGICCYYAYFTVKL